MDIWKFYDITHRRHLLCNPLSQVKFERLCNQLLLWKGATVIDIACGKGELLVRLAELYQISGIGVDTSPYFIKNCNDKKNSRVPVANLRFIEMDAANYKPGSDAPFDMATCLGAEWIFKTVQGTIKAVSEMTKDGGLVIIGAPFWNKVPSEQYLDLTGIRPDQYCSHQQNIGLGEELGLRCIYTLVSDHDDWDHYETLQLWAVDDHMKAKPDDPDNAEILKKVNEQRDHFLGGGREFLNWAVYVFRK